MMKLSCAAFWALIGLSLAAPASAGLPPEPHLVVEATAGISLVSGATVDMGLHPVASSTYRTLTIRNTGTAALSNLVFDFAEGHTSDFLTEGLEEPSIEPGASKTVSINYWPNEGGLRASQLHITSNDLVQSPFIVNFTGTASAGGGTVTDNFNDDEINEDRWTSSSDSVELIEGSQRLYLQGEASGENPGEGRLSLAMDQPTYEQNWEVTVDASNAFKFFGSYASLQLQIRTVGGNLISLGYDYDGTTPKLAVKGFVGKFLSDGNSAEPNRLTATNVDSVLKVAFNAATKVFTLSVDLTGSANGYQWQTLATYGIAGTGGTSNANWAMTSDESFDIALVGQLNGAFVGNPNILFFDNFSLTKTSIVPAAITKQPLSRLILTGQTAALSVIATGTSLNYQWYQGETGETSLPIEGATSATFTTPALTEQAAYWVRVSNSLGAVDSATAVISITDTPQPPEFLEQPESAVVTLGQSHTLDAVVGGTGTMDYQWKKGGVNVTGGSNSALTLNALTATNAGVYSLSVSNGVGAGETSDNAFLAVITPGPATQSVGLGANTTLTATVAFPAEAPVTYRWKQGTTLLDDGNGRTGTHDKTLTIASASTAHAGEYACVITMNVPGDDVTGETGITVLTVTQKPVLTSGALTEYFAPVRVAHKVDFVIPAEHGPTKFTVTGLPAGLKLDAATGRITGYPTTVKIVKNEVAPYLLKVSASNASGLSEVKDVLWTILSIGPEVVGNYYGLIGKDEVLADELGGTVKATITASGSFTGTLKLAAKSYTFKGSLKKDSADEPLLLRAEIPRKSPLPTLYVEFPVGQEAYEDQATAEVAGKAGSEEDGEAYFTVFYSPWGAKVPAGRFVDTYNTYFDPQGGDGPGGYSFAVIKVTAPGVASWTGKLADGIALTGSAPLGKGGQVAMHNMLYTNTGCFQGTQVISFTGGEEGGEPLQKLLDGAVYWVKKEQPERSTTRSYKLGFANTDILAVGAPNVKLGINEPVLGLSTEFLPDSNATLSFTESVVGTGDLSSHNVAINNKNAVKVETPNDFGVKLTVAAKTGNFSGGFSLKDDDPTSTKEVPPKVTRSVTFTGIIVKRPDLDIYRGVGFFNLAELPYLHEDTGKKVTNTSQWSGSVTLDPL